MKPALIVMAAGMGSRYGGLKQIDPVGPCGERIIDYSLFDAVRAGFGKVVFIIRRDIEKAFREAIEPGLGDRIPVEYAYQEIHSVPGRYHPPGGRTKPWGTGHAVLCCRDVVHEPFGVINADDFYGRDAFELLARGLKENADAPSAYMLVAYKLINTLSPHGSVSRGICRVSRHGTLQDIVEKTRIQFDRRNIVSVENGVAVPLDPDTAVSMNMWGFTPGIFDALDKSFSRFLFEHGHETGSEFFIPSVIDAMIKSRSVEVKVARTASRWMGMTYPADRETVRSGVESLIEAGDYASPLWPGAAMDGAHGMDHDGKTEKTRHIHCQPNQP